MMDADPGPGGSESSGGNHLGNARDVEEARKPFGRIHMENGLDVKGADVIQPHVAGRVKESAGDFVPTISPTREDGEKKKSEAAPSVPFLKLFSSADTLDYCLIFIGVLGAAVHGASLPVFFLFFGKLLNGIGTFAIIGSTTTVNKYAAYYLWLGIVTWGSSWAEVACWIYSGERQAARLRSRYLEALLKQDVSFFDTDEQMGSIVTSVSTDTLLVQDAISEKMGNYIHYISTFVTGFIIGFTSIWELALVTIAVVPLIAVAGGLYAWALTLTASKGQSSYAEAARVAEQATNQVRTVFSFVGESKAMSQYSKALQKTLKLGYRAGLAKGIGMGATYGVLFGAWALLLWYGGVLVRQGRANGGKALSTVFTVIIGGLGLGQAMPNITAFGRGKAAGYKIFKMIELDAKVNPMEGKQLSVVEGKIELRNVCFSYPSRPDVPIFEDFSLSIPAGRTVAIVGSSGSGKSTVVSLIERFYDPTSGEILLDGENITALSLKWLRAQIGLVNQEPALFATSIKENMLYGKENATMEELIEAAKLSNAHPFIEQLPLSYETQVGERGVQLSGGQKQRVAIARAILKNPTILLLDEATSALDAGSEQVVQDALDRVMVGRTTVIVAHRLSTIQNADIIAVVQKGAIVELGTHKNLIAKGETGAYATLVRLQEMATSVNPRGKYRLSERHSKSSFRMSHLNSRSMSLSQDNSMDSRRSSNAESDVMKVEEVVYAKPRASYRRLFKLNLPEWKYGIAGMAGSMLAGCINPLFAIIISMVLNVYYSTDYSYMRKQVGKYSLGFAALGVAAPIIYVLQHYSFGVVGENLVNRVREAMFSAILKNEVGWFDEASNNSNQISARLGTDSTNVRGAIGDRISILVQNATLILFAITASIVYQWKMALVMLATFPLLVFSAFVENLFLRGFSGDLAKAHARASQVAGEAVGNIRTIASFNAEEKVLQLFNHELEGPTKKSFLRGNVAGFGYGVSQLMMFGTYGLGLWYAGQLVARGDANFVDVIKVFMICIVSAFAVAETLALAPDMVKGGQALQSVFDVLDRRTAINADDPNALVAEKIKGTLELRKVTFAYPSRPDVIIFKDLSLVLNSGHSLALVGASGSGKSSVVALLERFYDPISGSVLIDGKDIRKYNLKSLRKNIALVQQEPALFSTTIYENIIYGKSEASEAEVIEAAKAANAYNFVSALPHGFQTEVGDRGIQLSGGQKQRIAIARAVLKNPAILLLDEATSALDAESEQIVQEALDRLMRDRTTVVVAHRLSTIRNANSIAVVQDGAIIEQGAHEELVSNSDGAYSRLVNLQQRL